MKLNHILTEDIEDTKVINSDDSTQEATTKIETEAEENKLEVSPKEILDASDKINAEKTIVDLETDEGEDLGLQVKNTLTDALDTALDLDYSRKKFKSTEAGNVLICGLPGSGKTASVWDWAKRARTPDGQKVNILYMNMKNNDLDAFINGYTIQNKDDWQAVSQAYSTNLNGLDRPNSILFLDEYNRQTNDQIRGSVLTLINEHYISGKDTEGKKYFPNFLFTIACMNPTVREDRGAAPLNDAERSRFLFNIRHADSDVDTTKEYLTKYWLNYIIKKELKSDNPNKTLLERACRIYDLGMFILNYNDISDPDLIFNYDTEDDLAILYKEQATMLNQRAFTNGLDSSGGKRDRFITWVERWSNFLDRDKQMLTTIADKYTEPSLDELFKKYSVDTGILHTSKVEDKPDELKSQDSDIDDNSNTEDLDLNAFFADSTGTDQSNFVPQTNKENLDKIFNKWGL